MESSGNTTVPSGREDSSGGSAPSVRLVYCLFIAHSYTQPDRIGERAAFDPDAQGPFIVGREKPGGPSREHFFQWTPQGMVDDGPLTGDNLSQDQLEIEPQLDGLRVHNKGVAVLDLNGCEVPRGAPFDARVGDVLHLHGNCVLVVGLSPLYLPPALYQALPRHPFGEGDAMGFYGESWRMCQLRHDVLSTSKAKYVLVLGESGTGKELVALAIHANSPRRAGPFIAANAASFTFELVAAELFGNIRGYPNPGMPARLGYFGQAKGGTLLLDEIGEVLERVQATLMRALMGTYNQIGDPVAKPTDCVVVLATNNEAGLKHDLRPRLGSLVRTPSLAERREDIALIVRGLLLRRADSDKKFADAFVRRDAHGWRYVPVNSFLIVNLLRSALPGNVRDIDNILEESIKLSGGAPPLRWPASVQKPPPVPFVDRSDPPPPSIDEQLANLGREAPTPSPARVSEALDMHDWHMRRTARYLKISEDQLYRLRVRYRLLERPVPKPDEELESPRDLDP